jgi:hypothetical protein
MWILPIAFDIIRAVPVYGMIVSRNEEGTSRQCSVTKIILVNISPPS